MKRETREIFKDNYSKKLLERIKERIVEWSEDVKANPDRQYKVNMLYMELGAVQKILWWEVMPIEIQTDKCLEQSIPMVLELIDLNLEVHN